MKRAPFVATDRVTDLTQARVEKRCHDCDPGALAERVLAVALASTARCDVCQHRLLSGEHYWAVLTN